VSAKANLLLQALPDAEREALTSHLEPTELKQHKLLFDIRDAITDVYFAADAVVSLVIPLSTGEVVETAMVGRDGVIGAAAALNGRVSLNQAIVQIGGQALRCPVEPLKEILEEHSHIRSVMGGHEQALLAQAQQSAACNVTHVYRKQTGAMVIAGSRPTRQRRTAIDPGIYRADVGGSAYECHGGSTHFARGGNDPLQAWAHKAA
jgi:CRP-like cAMP-binding protein